MEYVGGSEHMGESIERALVVGSEGNIGKPLVHALRAAGTKVVELSLIHI